MFIVNFFRRVGRRTYATLFEFFFGTGLLFWDLSLGLINTLTPKLKEGAVIPPGHPGAGGKWPEYIPPQPGDSRCSCPALNALANHGILPRNGRDIPFKELTRTVRQTYNFAPTFCLFVPRYMSQILGRSYSRDTLNLSDIDVHNGIEHDASLTRQDTYHQQDQALPDPGLIASLLSKASGKPRPPKMTVNLDNTLTPGDLSRALDECRKEARRTNPQYSLDMGHKLFGSSNSSTMLTIFGGQTRDLYTILSEERLPEGWEPRTRQRMGLTIGGFNSTVMDVEFGVKDEVERPLNLM
ncbi:Cloroperoxidase [Amylostereum chailletii]|nr:Cloroperoxidase [Amylostereum chailletii]